MRQSAWIQSTDLQKPRQHGLSIQRAEGECSPTARSVLYMARSAVPKNSHGSSQSVYGQKVLRAPQAPPCSRCQKAAPLAQILLYCSAVVWPPATGTLRVCGARTTLIRSAHMRTCHGNEGEQSTKNPQKSAAIRVTSS